MAALEDVKVGVFLAGVASNGPVDVESVERHEDQAIQIVYRDGAGAVPGEPS